MYVPFDTLPEDAKIWIYQSNRKFSDEELAEIENDLQSFIENWAAHGTSLEASYLLKYNRFIILAVNQEVQQATGCSIDSSVAFIQGLEQKYNVDLLDKMNVTFKNGGKPLDGTKPFEIAELFGVYEQTIHSNIRSILKSGVIRSDISQDMVMSGNLIVPDVYGLDMIIALQA